MAKPKVSYEESRRQRLEENKKRMEALNLPGLALALRTPPKPTPMKRTKPRKYQVEMVEARRSTRVANRPAPVYKEEPADRVMIPRRVYSTTKHRDLSNRIYASDKARAVAMEKATELEVGLGTDHPTLIKSMLQSHVTGGFWLGLQVFFCKHHLPKTDEVVTLIDEDGNEYPVIYLARKTGLSGGWKGFAVAHDLVDGDAVVFQLIKRTTFKVYIIRVERSE